MGDQPMIKVNVIGFAINVVFMSGFYYWASQESKSKLWQKFAYCSLFVIACITYTNFEDPKNVEFRLGMIITAILIWLVGSPMLNLPNVIKKKSTEGMPFPIIFAGQLVATAWTLYALSIHNTVMVVSIERTDLLGNLSNFCSSQFQNLFLWTLGAIQLSMFALYPNTPAKKPAGKKSSKKDN